MWKDLTLVLHFLFQASVFGACVVPAPHSGTHRTLSHEDCVSLCVYQGFSRNEAVSGAGRGFLP